MASKSWIAALAVLTAAAVGSYLGFRALQPAPLPEGFVYGNGHIEGTEIRVSAELPGRVIENRMEEGQLVRKGDALITLDALPTSESLRMMKAERQVLAAELAALQPQLVSWRHHLENASREFQRLQELKGRGFSTPQQLDVATNALTEAKSHVSHLSASMASLRAKQAVAEAAVVLAEDRNQKVTVRAPQDGTLLVKAVEVGEQLQIGQTVAMLVDINRLELKVYVSEHDLGRLALGNSARVRVDAFPDTYLEARLMRIDAHAQFTPRDIHLPDERARMVYGVTLALDNPQGRLKLGMPADAWLRWQDGAAWPATLPVPAE
ncbi:HlyD family secretion protein [Metapseudomonas boanensis]|uniref:Efflux RND transporter periplasmic adaptor subunit n=1 Tax=Metapseudomonas boanensis TaxID=2822138 RepID=A0ABS5XCC5_9GAMM|nr:HlyD family efflux transporter periplasmic adaptor subunit [Pseudomonas boanensis]MBT8764811.1 efflux RND transporter periplasmic adaptor subunit [Pseudomonas boanensis]